MPNNNIIVTARSTGSGTAVNRDDIHYAHPSSGFSLYFIMFGGAFFATNVSEVGGNHTIPSTANRPKTVTENGSAEQVAAVNRALQNAGNAPDLAASLDEMADLGVTLRIRVIAAPGDALPGEQARISFPANSNGAAPDTFVQGSEVTILVFGDRLSNSSSDTTFAFVLAHELTHLLRGADGQFLPDSGTGVTTYTREQEIYDALFGAGAGGSPNANLTVGLLDAQALNIVGTNMGDYIIGDDLGGSQGITWSHIYTGAGNDFIVSGEGSDAIFVDGPGKKIIYDWGGYYDSVTISYLTDFSSFTCTKVGSDLYVTMSSSTASVTEDSECCGNRGIVL